MLQDRINDVDIQKNEKLHIKSASALNLKLMLFMDDK